MKFLHSLILKFFLIILLISGNILSTQAQDLDTLIKHPDDINNTNYSLDTYFVPQGHVWGYRYGHNPTGQDGFAERYEVSEKSQVVNIIVNLAWGQFGPDFPDELISDDVATFSVYELSTDQIYENLPKATPIASRTIPYKELNSAFVTHELNVVTFDPPVTVEGEFFVAFELKPYKSGIAEYEEDDLIGIFVPNDVPDNVTDNTTTALRYSNNGTAMQNWHPAYGAYNKHVYFPVYPVVQSYQDPSALTENNFIASGGFKLYNTYPNPVLENSLNVEFEIDHPSDVSLTIYNVNGQRVEQLDQVSYERGKHKLNLDVSELSNGHYFYTLQAGNRFLSGKFMK